MPHLPRWRTSYTSIASCCLQSSNVDESSHGLPRVCTRFEAFADHGVLCNRSSRFGRQANKPSEIQNGQLLSPTSEYSSQESSSATSTPFQNASIAGPSATQSDSNRPDNNMVLRPVPTPIRRIPFFFREENSNLIAKGNFMTLAAKPEHVEKGEWLAHQSSSIACQDSSW